MKLENIKDLIDVMKTLRHPEKGCPWNREQTHQSLRRHLLEETYETLEAIDLKDSELLKEELGDLLLQVVFHCEIASENGEYTLDDIANDVAEKMRRRHPHVFDQNCRVSAKESLNNWDEIKKQEKLKKGVHNESLLDSIAKTLPALYEADKISKKAARQGFDWQKPEDVFDKVFEEINEVKEAIQSQNSENLEEEFGDLLVAVVNLCRVYKVNSEIALRKANQKFRKRFLTMEKDIDSKKLSMKNLSPSEWDDLWNQAKKTIKNSF